ncbi:hypothetical protein [Treponema sp.]|uniref:hypothetical protein n=1 Tax=Treponema sp. TaxID=166 RepID=UPI00298D616D|nr:hypothetical protein [Treponema sp.]MCR5613259.1 hypothetical protein [Treponema sp.]
MNKKIIFINILFLINFNSFSQELSEMKKNVLNSCEIYGSSEIVKIGEKVSFFADLPNKPLKKNLVVNLSRFEFGMMYKYDNQKLVNYCGSFLVKFIKTDGTEFSFIAELGKDSIYLFGDDYENFYFPDSFYGEHVNVEITVIKNDFPEFIDEVFFYVAAPRSK